VAVHVYSASFRRPIRSVRHNALSSKPLLPPLTATAPLEYNTPNSVMPNNEMPSGALMLLILRVLRTGPLHGYAIAQRIHVLSSEVLHVEEGALYPTLQKILLKGWVSSEWGISETNRKVRFYRLTPAGRKQLDTQLAAFERLHQAIQSVLRTA
jgi:PadR family transcriptional regulator PadR